MLLHTLNLNSLNYFYNPSLVKILLVVNFSLQQVVLLLYYIEQFMHI